MSTLAKQLDERLQKLDPLTAAHVERVIREVLALTEPVTQGKPPSIANGRGAGLVALASLAEPMGKLTNADIDRAVYGE